MYACTHEKQCSPAKKYYFYRNIQTLNYCSSVYQLCYHIVPNKVAVSEVKIVEVDVLTIDFNLPENTIVRFRIKML